MVLVTVMLRVNADVLAFEFASVNDPDVTVMTAIPPDDREAVNVAVYEVPLPEKLVRVPKRADTSEDVKVVVDSLTVNVTVVVEPDVNDTGLALIEIVGAAVSKAMLSVLDAVLSLPAPSVNRALATEILPVPDCVLAVGVKVAVYDVPFPVKLLIAPPVTVTSLEMKLAEDSDRVNVIVSVWLVVRSADPARVMVTVGAVVSTFCVD